MENYSWIFLVLIVVVFYFLLIRPQQRTMRAHAELMRKIGLGDEVVTQAGIFGTVTALEDDTLLIEISEGVEIRILRSSVAKNLTPPGEEEPDELEPDEVEELDESEMDAAGEEAEEEPLEPEEKPAPKPKARGGKSKASPDGETAPPAE
ncbi:MAG: preprotein translocase subunit YajC [Candidatus Geothermincolia bacterium]